MCDAVAVLYVRLSLNSNTRINPFDLPQVVDAEEADNALRSNPITPMAFFASYDGGAQAQMAANGAAVVPALAPSKKQILDVALIETYAKAGITPDPLTHTGQPQLSRICTTRCSTWRHWPSSWPSVCAYTTGTFAGHL